MVTGSTAQHAIKQTRQRHTSLLPGGHLCDRDILDEPLTAIDKEGVATLIALFEQHTQQGGMVLLTTQSVSPRLLYL